MKTEKMIVYIQRDYAIFDEMYDGMIFKHRNGNTYKIISHKYLSGTMDQEYDCVVQLIKGKNE